MEDNQRNNDFAPLVKRLAQGEWFTSRASAAGLFAVCYSAFDAQKQEEWRKYVS
jgi:serine/threonine-protein phosphatase 2A regulatory subunit A